MGEGHNFGYRKRPVIDGKIQCAMCVSSQLVAEFYVNPSTGRRDTRCNRCRRAASCARNLNISVERYLALIAAGRCEICDSVTTSLHVDHDHANGKIRGVLCDDCNKGLGMFRDDYVRLVQAAYYVGKYEDLHRDLPISDEDRIRNERMALINRKR